MSWKNRWPERQPRPKVKRLSKAQKDQILATLSEGVDASPVLSVLDIRVRALRGRFYFERLWNTAEENSAVEVIGRATPLDGYENTLLLEVEKRKGNWYTVIRGTAEEVVKAIATDTKGTFHGLGTLDKSLRQAGGNLNRLEVAMEDEYRFVYAQTGEECAVQEALFHFFGMPIKVIAEPREWYVYHRRPEIVEVSQDRSGILVRFSAMSMSGSTFGGTCLYTIVDDRWQAFTIKPNQSDSIATAIAWLQKRQWREW
jgi:hypothetical protein